MKAIILVSFLLHSVAALAAPSEEVMDFLESKKVDLKEFDKLDADSTKILTATIETDKQYLEAVIKSTESLQNTGTIDPKILVSAAEVKVQLTDNFQTNRNHEYMKVIDRSLATEAKFPIASASGNLSNNVFAIQYAAYREFPEGSGKFYGYGLYMTIDASNIAANSDVSLPYLAASATMQSKSYNREAQLIGIEGVKANELLNIAFPGDTFDITNFSGYAKFKSELNKGLADKSITISPVPIELATIKQIMEKDGVTLVRTSALISIAKGKTLTEAINGYNPKTSDTEQIIKNVYLNEVGISNNNSAPSSNQKSLIKHKLEAAGVKI